MDWNVWHWIGLPSRRDIRELTPLIKTENSKCVEVVLRESQKLTTKFNDCVTTIMQAQSTIEQECESLLRQFRRGMTELGMQLHKDAEEGKTVVSKLLDDGIAKLKSSQTASTHEFSKLAKDMVRIVDTIEERMKKETDATIKSLDRLTAATKSSSKLLQQEAADFAGKMTYLVDDCRSAIAAVMDQETTTTNQMDKIISQFDAMQEVLRLYMINALIDYIPEGKTDGTSSKCRGGKVKRG